VPVGTHPLLAGRTSDETISGHRLHDKGLGDVVPAGGRVASRAREPRPTPELRLLTDREREVMGLVAAGPTNVELW
jgi:DNA-binding NarL/FixJ family response regulator